MNLEPEMEIRSNGPNGPAGHGGNSRLLHILAELRAASPEGRNHLVADYKRRGLRPDAIDELAAVAARYPASTADTGTTSVDLLTALIGGSR